MERIEQDITVNNPNGLHARPAALFVQLANTFDSSVWLDGGEMVDGKSIIAILSLGVQHGSSIKLIVEGEDAPDAFRDLKSFLEKGHD